MSLLDTYNQLKETQKEAQAVQENTDARLEVLSEYVKMAGERLEAEYPGQWTQEEQAKLAMALIDIDAEEEEKVAEVQKIAEKAIIFARVSADEWKRLGVL